MALPALRKPRSRSPPTSLAPSDTVQPPTTAARLAGSGTLSPALPAGAMVETRRSSAAKRRASSEEASPSLDACSPPPPVEPPSPTRSRGRWASGPRSRYRHACVDGGGISIFRIKLVPGRRKKNRPTRSFATDEGTLWKTRPVSASGWAEAWGRLISQSSEVREVNYSGNSE